jgi:hypothetical protein
MPHATAPAQELAQFHTTASVLGLHESGTFDAKEKLWTRSLALRRGGTVVVVEDYGTDDENCDGAWCV